MYNEPKINLAASAGQAAPESMLSMFNGSLGAEIVDLAMSAKRLHAVADRVLGSRPQAVDDKAIATGVGCSMQELERNIAAVRNLRCQIVDAVERFERL